MVCRAASVLSCGRYSPLFPFRPFKSDFYGVTCKLQLLWYQLGGTRDTAGSICANTLERRLYLLCQSRDSYCKGKGSFCYPAHALMHMGGARRCCR